MPWIYLALAGLFEVVWAVGLKYTEGFSLVSASHPYLCFANSTNVLLCNNGHVENSHSFLKPSRAIGTLHTASAFLKRRMSAKTQWCFLRQLGTRVPGMCFTSNNPSVRPRLPVAIFRKLSTFLGDQTLRKGELI